jgi:hypothetical protein
MGWLVVVGGTDVVSVTLIAKDGVRDEPWNVNIGLNGPRDRDDGFVKFRCYTLLFCCLQVAMQVIQQVSTYDGKRQG